MPVGKVKTSLMIDDSAYEDPKLVGEIEKTLQAFNSETDSSTPTPPVPVAKPSEPTPQEPAADADDSTPQGDVEGAAAEPAEGDTAGEPAQGEPATKPAIPDNYYRAAVHSGLTPEQISGLYEKDPDVAMQVLEGLYKSQNKLSQQFAQAGRTVRALEQTKQQQVVTPQPQPAPGLDLNKLREKYDEDPFGAMVELIKSVKSEPQIQPQVVQPQGGDSAEVIAQQKMLAYEQLVNFFGGEEMGAYSEFYGPANKENRFDFSDLSPGQLANRKAVTEIADAIIAGVEFQGGQISIAEALEKAHLMVSQPITQQIVREKIVSQIKKRSKGITLKPSAGQTPPAKGGKGTSEAQLLADTQARLNAIKW